MKKALYSLLLSALMLQAAEVNLTGNILDSESKPVVDAVVTLASESLSDTTDATGAYSLSSATSISITKQTPKQSMKIQNHNLHISLATMSSFSVQIFTVDGRLISQRTKQNLRAGSHQIPLFNSGANSSLASNILLMKATINGKTFTTKFLSNSGTQSIKIAMPSVVTSSEKASSISSSRAQSLDTLSVFKGGQKIMNIPLTSLIATLPDYQIVQRDISGDFSRVAPSGIGYIQAVVTGDDNAEGGRIDLWHNEPNNSYSGFMYTSHTAETKDYALYIEVFSPDSLLIGRCNTTPFTTMAGDITIPVFDPENGARTISISDPTIADLDDLSNGSDFYSTTYRPATYDSLGVRGGNHSGGFLDSWGDETQLQIALSGDSFTIVNTKMVFTVEPTGYMYWMALALGQEYFNVDLQLMAATGAKETFAGLNIANSTYLTATEYGPWHIEGPSGLDRSLNYPQMFPKYEVQLEAARDAVTSGIDYAEFMSYYCNNKDTYSTAHMANSMVVTAIFFYNNYELLNYSTDIKWLETLETAIDPYFGVASLLIMHNVGAWSQMGKMAGLMSSTTYQTTAADANARDLVGPGNNNYIPEILTVAQNLIDASKMSLTDAAISIMDKAISLGELKQIYFGDNGTATVQGDGGLLLHYDLSPTERTEIDGTLTNAFNTLKGKAPSALGQDAVSLRYDFLSIIRTVKQYFPFESTKPTRGDSGTLITQYSTGN
jgi:hypothetical protein